MKTWIPLISKNFKKLLNRHKSIFTDNDIKYLNEADYNTKTFQRLPMSRIITHASKRQNSEVFSINKLQDLKVRPIKGGPKCPSRKFSDLIYTLLKPFLKHEKNYIRDSIYFLNKCDRNLDGNTVIPTFLVVCLYANIPHLFRLEVVRYFLLKFPSEV